MNPEFPEGLVDIIKQKALTLEYVKDWLVRRNKEGKLNNLDYIETLNALKEYERSQPR